MHGNPSPGSLPFLSGGGDMGERMRAHDWSSSPLGHPSGWPQPLRTLIGVVLASCQPMFIAWGPERILLYNDGYAPMLGQRHPGALGQRFNEVWFDILDQVGPLVDRAYAGEPTQMDDIMFIMHRNGFPEETHFAFAYTPVRDESGTVAGMVCTCNETTTAVRARAAQRESERRFQNLADHAPVMIWVTEPDGTCSFLSRSWYEFTGQTPETGLGFGWLEAVHPGDRGWSGEVFRAANIKREPFRLDYRLRRADGVYRWVIDAAAPRFSEDGRFLGYVGSVIDITDRKHAEERLRESEAEFRTVANAAPALVWVGLASGEIIFLNERWHEFTGQSVEEAQGFGWVSSIHPDDARRILPYWERCREGGEMYEGEIRYRRQDGEYRWHAFRALPRGGSDQSVAKWFGISVDIHERKRWEEQQRLLINELNHRVKNTLATVQAMAAQSFRGLDGTNLPKVKAFEERLFALARAHDVLTRENWEGAELCEVITEVIEPYLRQNAKFFEITGPRLRLDPRTALAIAMAIYELATNAAKYGALSVPTGCVTIT
ncbi:PAS domain-containing sensor histidine kinase [Microvirga massiliensis]|uniref:PAS domain-containing sensor histidine kinase n=1 Tax=Microvirga massiliensis TaxID=1033741 RepID=UPI0009E582D1|nr:PAS domain S-box protein [Microvirga massiliensis]